MTLIVLPSGREMLWTQKRLSAFSSKRSQSAFVRSALLKHAAMTISKFLLNSFRQWHPFEKKKTHQVFWNRLTVPFFPLAGFLVYLRVRIRK